MEITNKIRAIIFLLSFSIVSFAQQDAQFSQYMFVNSYFNPAYVGINEQTEFVGIYRSQWTGFRNSGGNDNFSGVPVTQFINASTKIKAINSGIGFNIVNDNIATLNNLYLKANYSYHINISEDVKLGIGIGAGYFNQRISTDLWKPNQDNDPRLDQVAANPSQSSFDIDGGLWLLSKKISMGISLSHLLQPQLFKQQINSKEFSSTLKRHAYLFFQYKLILNENWNLLPTLLLRSSLQALNNTQADLTVLASYSNYKFWGGISYRHTDAMIALIGISFLKNNALRVGYGFDLTIIGKAAKMGTSHEIMASFFIPVRDLLPKPMIRTPRFRY